MSCDSGRHLITETGADSVQCVTPKKIQANDHVRSDRNPFQLETGGSDKRDPVTLGFACVQLDQRHPDVSAASAPHYHGGRSSPASPWLTAAVFSSTSH